MEDFLEQMRNDHKDFDHGSLEGNFGSQPFELFSTWFSEAIETKQVEPNAFVLSTVNTTLQTSSRILYLKEVMEEQFVFYTNYNSHKGTDLMHNNTASMLFFWPNLQRQVRIEGVCAKVATEISDAYFASRPRASQIGAWASNQSEKLEDPMDATCYDDLDTLYCLQKLSFGKEGHRVYTIELYLNETLINGKSTG